MALIKLTKTTIDAAISREKDYELRDTVAPGFICKITRTGHKVFMLNYRTNWGERRKPAIGRFGEVTVEQARAIAQDMLADVRRGDDPSAAKLAMRQAPTVAELCTQYLEEYSRPRNKPSTVKRNESLIKLYIVPNLGRLKVPEVVRPHVTGLLRAMNEVPVSANRALACIRKMFNLAEVWEYRPDGSNPCRHVPKYPEKGRTRFITNDEVSRIYAYLDRADAEGLEHPILTLAVRLHFEFAARMSEILALRWEWIDLENRRLAWPDSKTSDMSKPISHEAYRLLTTAYRYDGSPFVCPAIFKPFEPMSKSTYYAGWCRILQRCEVPHVGTHGIRHRAATDIANSGVPTKVGMVLTAHKTVQMFMRYVHTEDNPVRAAANKVANQRKALLAKSAATASDWVAPASCEKGSASRTDVEQVNGTALGNYRPFRHRTRANRAIPPGSKHSTSAARSQ